MLLTPTFRQLVAGELHARALIHAAIALAPMLALLVATRSTVWSQAMLVTVSAIIAKETAQLAPLGVVLHAFAIVAGFLILIGSMNSPVGFVIAACLIAAGSILIASQGAKLRILGNFTFIPTLYLACEIGEKGGSPLLTSAVAFLPCIAVAFLPVVFIAAIDHARDHDPKMERTRHLRSLFRRAANHGVPMEVAEALIAVLLAVGAAAAIVERYHLDYGQWVIWSAASVVVGDFKASRRKLYDRYLGAVIGVPIGTVIGLVLPQNDAIRTIAGIGAVLTLLAFRRYVVGFAARCTLIALILVDAGQSTFSAIERIENVGLGGAIGITFVVIVHGLDKLRRRFAAVPNDHDGV